MIRKKRMNLLLAACLLAFICIGGSGPLSRMALNPAMNLHGGGVPAASPDQPVKIKFGMWETKMDILFWTSKVKEYSRIRPNVTVEVETIPDNSGQYLKVRLASNDLPDVFYLKASHLSVYRDALLPLNGLKAAQSNRFPAVYNGDILGLPLVSFSEYVFYHPSIFRELNLQVPQTLDEFVQVLEEIKNHDKYIPIAIGGKEDWTFYPFIEFGPPLLSKDPNYLTNLSHTLQPFGRNSPFETAAKLLKTIAEHRLAGSDALSIGFDESKQLFESNKAAMIALGQWYYQDYISNVKTDEDLDAFALPWRSDAREPLEAVTMPDQYMAINKASKNVDEIKSFLEWIYSPEVYQDYINYSGNTSTMVNIPSDQPFFNKVKRRHPFDPFMYYGMNERFEMVKNKAQYNEKKTAQDIFAGASVEDMQQLLNRNWSQAVEQLK
ncbi:ABC transporter substrate-binding protein [Paenibacillus sp. SAF-054]